MCPQVDCAQSRLLPIITPRASQCLATADFEEDLSERRSQTTTVQKSPIRPYIVGTSY